MDAAAKVLIGGKWQAANASGTFHATNPAIAKALPITFPTSRWSDCDLALSAAMKAATELRAIEPAKIAAFLEAYASNIEASADSLVPSAVEETALAAIPRLKDVELPRTTNQLRQAAAAVREESWRKATLDLEKNIRSCFAPIGPVTFHSPSTVSAEEISLPQSPPAIRSLRRPIPCTPTPHASSRSRHSRRSKQPDSRSRPFNFSTTSATKTG